MEKVKITHPDKVLFPKSGITKGDLVNYYTSVAEWMLPHLHGRPISIQRYPEGIGQQNFFQKEASEYFPSFVKRQKVKLRTGESKQYITVENVETLAYLANLGTIPLHTWLSCKGHLNTPDMLIWDFDPSDKSFDKAREGAFIARDILKKAGITPFLKTTGSRGLHVIVALEPQANYTKVRSLAQKISVRMAKENPKLLTTAFEKADRGNRVFVDYLRNGFAQTAIAPYSVRAIENAPVAAPITWKELEKEEINAQAFNISNIVKRLHETGDLLKDLHQRPYKLEEISRALEE
jgi:bifunctional non-homologous end joining protein LigD